MNPKLLYKIVPRTQWEIAQEQGEFRGLGIDVDDGFIHLSTADQYQETLEKYFSGQTDLMCLGIDGDQLGDSLKWETSRGGALFPHVYAPIPLAAIVLDQPIESLP